jgi:hypothetical protein
VAAVLVEALLVVVQVVTRAVQAVAVAHQQLRLAVQVAVVTLVDITL